MRKGMLTIQRRYRVAALKTSRKKIHQHPLSNLTLSHAALTITANCLLIVIRAIGQIVITIYRSLRTLNGKK